MLFSDDCVLALFDGFEVVWEAFKELGEDIGLADCKDKNVV